MQVLLVSSSWYEGKEKSHKVPHFVECNKLFFLADAAKIYAIFYIRVNNESVNVQRKLNFVYQKTGIISALFERILILGADVAVVLRKQNNK